MADLPHLTSDSNTATPLEVTNATFIVQQAHMAKLILSVRGLDTGSARDVSGILRITTGSEEIPHKELEKRYLVQRDGAVKIVE